MDERDIRRRGMRPDRVGMGAAPSLGFPLVLPLVLCLSLLLCISPVHSGEAAAQQGGSIVGRVVDDATDEPVQGAIVSAETADSDAVGQTLTNDSGRFVLRLREGAAFDRVHVERIGYRTETFERSALPASGSWTLRVGTEPIARLIRRARVPRGRGGRRGG